MAKESLPSLQDLSTQETFLKTPIKERASFHTQTVPICNASGKMAKLTAMELESLVQARRSEGIGKRTSRSSGTKIIQCLHHRKVCSGILIKYERYNK